MQNRLRLIAFAVALIALIIVAFRHSEAALAVVAGSLAIIGAVAGFDL